MYVSKLAILAFLESAGAAYNRCMSPAQANEMMLQQITMFCEGKVGELDDFATESLMEGLVGAR